MIDIHRVLCPIDFSDVSRRALDYALAIATRYESSVSLLHVAAIVPTADSWPGHSFPPSMILTEGDREAVLASMRQFASIDSASIIPIQYEIAEGRAAAEILAKAEAMRADLLVLGTHGRSGFERLVLGSVAEKVLRKAACPVLSVPPHVAGTNGAGRLFKRILCAVDFSDCSRLALNYATSLAQEGEARLTVVHVIDSVPQLPADLHETTLAGPRSLEEYVAAAENDARDRLKDAVPDAGGADVTVDTVVARGKSYREILRIAAEQRSDLIVIGIHGRGALDLMFFGSTAQHVVRQATCPVLTLRRNGAQQRDA